MHPRPSLFLALLALFLLTTPHAQALDLHIAPTGNDTWSGRPATPNPTHTDGPFATLDGARLAIRRLPRPLTEPIHVIFATGTYRLTEAIAFTAADSGEPDREITYESAPNAEVILSGGQDLPRFTPAPNGRWELTIPTPSTATPRFEQLWINHHRAIRARSIAPGQPYPFLRNLEEETPVPVAPPIPTSLSTSSSSTSPPSHSSSSPATATPIRTTSPSLSPTTPAPTLYQQTLRTAPADLAAFRGVSPADARDAIVSFYHKWDNTRRRVESVDPATGLLVIRGGPVKPHNPLDYNTGFIVENLLSLLDQPGEWFLSREGRLTYLPLSGETPAETTATYPVAEKFLTLTGDAAHPVQFLRFTGLKFRHARGVASTDTFEANQAAVRTVDGVITLAHARQVTFAGCELSHFGSYGFSLQQGCREITVDHCLITDMGAGGIKIGTLNDEPLPANHTSHNHITASIIRDGGIIYPCAVGLWIGCSSDNEITHNEISDLFYSAISVGWRWGYAPSSAKRNRIEYNHLHHLGQGLLSDMGGVYTLGPSEGTSVSHNLIHDITCTTYGGWGLYTDEGSTGITMEGNVVYNTTDGGFHQHYGRDNLVRNNIFAFATEVQVKRTRAEEHRSFTFERNLIVYNRGDLLGGNWSGTTANVPLDHNLYWDYSGRPIAFPPKQATLAAWQQTGQDAGSVIADPLFVNPVAHDFRLRPGSPALALGFQPIDVSTMGVTGDPAWRTLAATFARPPAAPRPPKQIPPAVNIRQNFEGRITDVRYAFPHAQGTLAERKPGQPSPGDSLNLTGAQKSEGRQSLLFLDAPGLPATYYPMLAFRPNHRAGTSTVSFDLYLEPKAIFVHEWRNDATPYQAGPSLRIKDGQLTVPTVKSLSAPIPLQRWVHFELTADLGPATPARWHLRLTPAGGPTQDFEDLPFRAPGMTTLDWVGFISAANEKTEFYLDNLAIATTAPTL